MARRAQAPRRMKLPGEPESTDVLEDVILWCSVYSELLRGFRHLAAIEARTRRATRLNQVKWLEMRSRFWENRRDELGNPSHDAGSIAAVQVAAHS